MVELQKILVHCPEDNQLYCARFIVYNAFSHEVQVMYSGDGDGGDRVSVNANDVYNRRGINDDNTDSDGGDTKESNSSGGGGSRKGKGKGKFKGEGKGKGDESTSTANLRGSSTQVSKREDRYIYRERERERNMFIDIMRKKSESLT